MLIKYFPLSLILFTFCCLTPCKAQVTDTYTGGGADNKISTNANWLSGSKPSDPNTEITIASWLTMVVDENFMCKTLRINAGGSFRCEGGILTITEGIYDKDGVKRIDIESALQISSSVMIDEIPTSGTFTDARDGQLYNCVKIGNQVWMAKNLAYLPSVVGSGTGSNTTPYYYVYGYNGTDALIAKATANYTTYGVLYNWPAAMNGATSSATNPSGIRGVCPSGWHLPSDAEWTELMDYLAADGYSGTENTALKATSGWSSGGNGTDNYGFSGLPGGYRLNTSIFYGITLGGTCWSSTESSMTNAWYRNLYFNLSYVYRDNYYKALGYSVRCLRD